MTGFSNWVQTIPPVAISIVISLVSLSCSILAAKFSRHSWRETYRPIIVVEMECKEFGVSKSYFIIIKNCGNRSAFNIRLTSTETELPVFPRDNIESSELTENEIPVLLPGEAKEREFIGEDKAHNIAISIKYKDQDGRVLKSKQNIAINPSEWIKK